MPSGSNSRVRKQLDNDDGIKPEQIDIDMAPDPQSRDISQDTSQLESAAAKTQQQMDLKQKELAEKAEAISRQKRELEAKRLAAQAAPQEQDEVDNGEEEEEYYGEEEDDEQLAQQYLEHASKLIPHVKEGNADLKKQLWKMIGNFVIFRIGGNAEVKEDQQRAQRIVVAIAKLDLEVIKQILGSYDVFKQRVDKLQSSE